jgi:hypothetical protein
MEELLNYYNLDEVIERGKVINKLKEYSQQAKIELSIEGDTIYILDIDLDESDIQDILKLFDENDVFPDYDKNDDDDIDDDFFNFYDDLDDY